MKDIAPDTDITKDRLRLWLKILKVQGTVDGVLRRRFREEFGTTLPRFDVMSALARHPDGLRMSEISDLLKVSNGNVTGIVDRLVTDGQAVRSAVPGDRRAHRVALTADGAEVFARQAAAHALWVSNLLGHVEAQDFEALMHGLDVMTDGWEAADAQ